MVQELLTRSEARLILDLSEPKDGYTALVYAARDGYDRVVYAMLEVAATGEN